MAPKVKGKVSKTPGQFRLSTSPFVEDSVKEKVKRWNLADPISIEKEEIKIKVSKTSKEKKKEKQKGEPKRDENSPEKLATSESIERPINVQKKRCVSNKEKSESSSKSRSSQQIRNTVTKEEEEKQEEDQEDEEEYDDDDDDDDDDDNNNNEKDEPRTPEKQLGHKLSNEKFKTMSPHRSRQINRKVSRTASTPRRRIRSDGAWISVRSPPKKSPEPKPPPPPKLKTAKYARGPAGNAWVRPAILPRQHSASGPAREFPASAGKRPVMSYSGQLRKPIWHQFDLYKERERIAEKRAIAEKAGTMQFPLEFRKAKTWIFPGAKTTAPESDDTASDEKDEGTEEHVSESDDDDDNNNINLNKSDKNKEKEEDYEDVNETDSSAISLERKSPNVNRSVSIQPSPLQLTIPKSRKGDNREKVPSRISTQRRHSSIEKSQLRIEASPLPSQYHNRGKSTGNIDEFKSPTITDRKLSYNPAPLIPQPLQTTPLSNKIAARLGTWLSTTPDPFSNSSEKEKSSNKSFAHKLFSFDREKRSLKSPAIQKSPREDSDTTPSRPPRSFDRERERGHSEDRENDRYQGSRNYPRSLIEKDGRSKSYGKYPQERSQEPSKDYRTYSEGDYPSSTSTPTLRRSGAKRNSHLSPSKEYHRHSPKSQRHYYASDSQFSESVVTESQFTESDVSTSVITESTVSGDLSSSNVSSNRQIDDIAPEHPGLRKPFPSTGKRLSTIVSVESFDTKTKQDFEPITEESELTQKSSTKNPLIRDSSFIKTQTKDFSLPLTPEKGSAMSRTRSVVSVVSTRSLSTKLRNTNVEQIMKDLAADEESFAPELKTLVSGVIQVLFKAVLSSSEGVIAANLFSRFINDRNGEKDARQAIHEMGVALERLKSYHLRIPIKDTDAFLVWANGAHRIYTEYVRTWRLGFQDVVVELVPEDNGSTTAKSNADDESVANMPRNDKGVVINKQGELIDVAFLLKRPLVRLKFLAKTIRSIHILKPNERSAVLKQKYDQLMETTRQKVNDERARMEDQKAIMTDTTRARDPKTLAPLNGVKIDSNRHVKARDFFEMNLIHSTGQEVTSRIEILIRDDPPEIGFGGDILICQADESGRWLFLPPIMLKNVSARTGTAADELVVMIRGFHSAGSEWREIMSLKSGEADVAIEWLKMLGTHPIPPAFSRESIVKKKTIHRNTISRGSSLLSGSEASASTDQSNLSRPPSQTPTELWPIGEPAGPNAKHWGTSTPNRSRPQSPLTPTSSTMSGEIWASQPATEGIQRQSKDVPQKTHRNSTMIGDDLNQKRTRDHNRVATAPLSSKPSVSRSSVERSGKATSPLKLQPNKNSDIAQSASKYSVWLPNSDINEPDDEDDKNLHFSTKHSLNHRISSAPASSKSTPRNNRNDLYYIDVSARSAEISSSNTNEDSPPPPPPHRIPLTKKSPPSKLSSVPQLSPSAIKRRSSSPLKHEYQPSEPDLSYSESEESDQGSFLSSGEEDDLQAPLSVLDIETATITPSQSASQVPYSIDEAYVENQPNVWYTGAATISQWNPNTNPNYTPLHDQQCFIEVNDGKVSAFEAIITPSNIYKKPQRRPIVSLALTPAVQVQLIGTTDVMIRSLLESDSIYQLHHRELIRIRFHFVYQSYTHAFMEALNEARKHNAKFNALMKARPSKTQAELFDAQNPGVDMSRRASWFGKRNNSFRKTQTRSGSTVGNTEKSYRSSSGSSFKQAFGTLARAANFNIDASAIFSRRSRPTGYDSRGSAEYTEDPSQPSDAFARMYPSELQSTIRTATCRMVQMRDGKQIPCGSVILRILPSGSRKSRIVISGKDKIWYDVVPGNVAMQARGIAVSIVWEVDNVRARGGVGTRVGEKVYLDMFESESMRAWIFEHLNSQ